MATNATRFDAASDRATYSGGSGAPPTPSAGWAASWWMYISTDRNDFSTMLRLHASSGGSTILNLAMSSAGTAPSAYTVGGTVEVGTQCVVATWYYLGYSVSGTTITIYVFDAAGSLFATASGTIGGGTPTGLTVGGRSVADSLEWFDGRLSRMRIWSATRTQAEFAAEQFAAEPVITANLWEYYRLAGAGDLAGDNGHDLTAGSTATTTEDGPPLSTGVTGSATVALGGPSVAATGARVMGGSAAVTLGASSAVGAGTRGVTAQVAAALGALSAVGGGTRSVTGQASITPGGLSVMVVARRDTTGVAVVAPGGLGVSAVAARKVSGGSTVALPSLSVAATGQRGVVAAVVVTSGVVVAATGHRLVRGSATAALPGLSVVIMIIDDHDVTVAARLAPQGRISARLGARRVAAALGAQR